MACDDHNHLFLTCFCFQRINEKPQIVQEYESGKAIPNNQIQSKMERALGMSDSQPEKYSLF